MIGFLNLKFKQFRENTKFFSTDSNELFLEKSQPNF